LNKRAAGLAILLFALLVAGCESAQVGAPSSPTPLAATPTVSASATAAASSTPTPVVFAGICVTIGGLPDRNCTPGVVDPAVTQGNLKTTICHAGYTATVRPPVDYTNGLKKQGMADYGEPGTAADYEEDHLIPLELGGSPRDPKNLWPEPRNIYHGASAKDVVENGLNDLVCDGRMTLSEAQSRIAANWQTALP
jgi:hypothetical protein